LATEPRTGWDINNSSWVKFVIWVDMWVLSGCVEEWPLLRGVGLSPTKPGFEHRYHACKSLVIIIIIFSNNKLTSATSTQYRQWTIPVGLHNRSTARTVKCNQYDLNDSLQAEPVYKWK